MDIPDASDLVPELICLSVDALICGILYKVYSDTNSAIQAVKVNFFCQISRGKSLLESWVTTFVPIDSYP